MEVDHAGGNLKALVIGGGYVGQAYASMMARRYEVLVLDPPRGLEVTPEQMNGVALAIVAVPTPPLPSGAADTRIVEAVVKDLPRTIPLVLIKSTVPPGTTAHLIAKH